MAKPAQFADETAFVLEMAGVPEASKYQKQKAKHYPEMRTPQAYCYGCRGNHRANEPCPKPRHHSKPRKTGSIRYPEMRPL